MDVPQMKHRQNKCETIVHNENDAAGPSSEHVAQMEVDVTEPLTECNQLRAEIAVLKSKNDLQAKELSEYRTTVQMLLSENSILKKKLSDLEISLDGFRGNDEKTTYFFGLSSFSIMDSLFLELMSILPECPGKLSKFEIFFITLNRLRLSTSFTFFKYKFNVSHQTISKYFHKCLFVLHSALKSLVYWPEREILKSAMPKIFKQNFGDAVTIVVDCFEIAIQTSTQKKAVCQTWSNYKHGQTGKFLIGISPSGFIMFISSGFVGRASDKKVTTDSGFLSYLKEGDVVMADRGFLVRDEIKNVGAELKMPVFTKGKNQLHPLEVEQTRKIANVRIHVERVIGQLRLKFKILDLRKFPLTEISKNVNGDSVMDQIVFVSCALINLCNPIVID